MLDRAGIKLHVDRHLLSALDLLPPALRSTFEDVLRERCLLAPDPAPYFEPLAHPVFELPVWVASRLRDDGTDVPEEVLSDVLGVSALGYLHVRALDDWLDGLPGGGADRVALAGALMASCNRLLGPVVGPSPRFWDLCGEILTAHAGSVVRAAAVRRDGAPVRRVDFEQLLAQSRPLVIPSAALLDRAGREDLLEPLEEFVFSATAASQLVNDLTDLYRDRAAGHRTWTLDVVGAATADGLWTEVAQLPGSGSGGRLRERIAEALAFHERSARAARTLAPGAASAWLAARRAMLESLPGRLHENLLDVFVGRLGRSPAGRPERVAHTGEERSS